MTDPAKPTAEVAASTAGTSNAAFEDSAAPTVTKAEIEVWAIMPRTEAPFHCGPRLGRVNRAMLRLLRRIEVER